MIHRNLLHVLLPLLSTTLRIIGTITLVQGQNSTSSNNDDDNGSSSSSRNRNMDLFNYDTNQHTAQYFNYGPEDWGDIRCPDKDICVRTKKRSSVLHFAMQYA